MKTKICGLRERQNVKDLEKLHPQWMGFIFAETSPRYFYKANEPAILSSVPPAIKKVGVFVNATLDMVRETIRKHELNMVQLHGSETPEYCKALQSKEIQVIKAFNVNSDFDFGLTESYALVADYFLLDAKGDQLGGNGIVFNWDILNGKRFAKPFLLSGGISSAHVDAIKKFKHPDCIGIDINSRFESSPGMKDVNSIRLFLQQVQS